MCMCLHWPVEGVAVLGAEVTDACEFSNCECWVLNSGPVEGQQ